MALHDMLLDHNGVS